jgi:GxxExxY protein
MDANGCTALTDQIICCFYKIYNILGYGFLEKVYENAMSLELESFNVDSEAQKPISVVYCGKVVGEYFCDLLVEEKVIVEIKAVRSILPEHEAQLLNYLKATDVEIGLLLNFGPKPEIKRKVFANVSKY